MAASAPIGGVPGAPAPEGTVSLEAPEAAAIHPPDGRREQLAARRQRRMKILLPILLVVVFLVYGFTTNFIPSESMLPTLKPGDHIVTMRSWLAYPGGRSPSRGDIVVFDLPREQAAAADRAAGWDVPAGAAPDDEGGRRKLFLFKPRGEVLIKRVVGLPGETVQVRRAQVFINGQPIRERYRTMPAEPDPPGYYPYAVEQPLKLGADEVFCLGDNPDNSEDGRFWGPLKKRFILGRFVRVLFHESSGPNERAARAEEQRQSQP